jgi:hypothetical protein
MFVKTLGKPFNISKFLFIDQPLFSTVRLFEVKHYFSNFFSFSYTLLCRLIGTVQENNKNWKLSEDFIDLD